MEIKSLYLKGYKRLMLTKINEITITPKELTQLIIGTNGSGKSSVLRQLTPFLPDREEFNVGGYKAIEIEHNDITYRLNTSFGKRSANYNFIKIQDGVEVELNEGGTGGIQKDLILEIFGIDQSINDLMMGNVRFTDLSPQARREWLMTISGLNLEYCAGLYKKAVSAGRDVQGARKLNTKRITDELSGLWSDEEMDQQQKRKDYLTERASELLRLSDGKGSQDVLQDTERRLESIVATLSQKADRAERHIKPGTKPTDLARSPDELQTMQIDANDALTRAQSEIDFKLERVSKIDKEVARLQEQVTGDPDEIRGSIGLLKLSIADLSNIEFPYEDVHSTWPDLSRQLAMDLDEIISGLTDEDLNPTVDRGKYDKAREARSTATQVLDVNRAKAEKIRGRLEHIASAEHANCPECNFKFVPGVPKNSVELLTKSLDEARKLIEYSTTSITMSLKVMDEFERHQTIVEELRILFKTYPQFTALWNVLSEDRFMFNYPLDALRVAYRHADSMRDSFALQTYKKKLAQFEETLIRLTGNGSVLETLNALTEESTRLSKEIHSLSETRRKLCANKELYDKAIRDNRAHDEILKQLTADTEGLSVVIQEYTHAVKQHAIETELWEVQNELVRVSSQLTHNTARKEIYNDVKGQCERLEEEEADWKILADNLSPVKGLIAELLTGFLTSLTGSMNKLINQVWQYELNIQPCKPTQSGLDYKFPVQTANDGVSKDIRDCSDGQKDIINFVFRVVAMAYLKLNHYPLYADELEAFLDETHKESLGRLLRNLVVSGECSQLIMISHAFAVSNTLGKCDVCVLDASNITVPAVYNEHVDIS